MISKSLIGSDVVLRPVVCGNTITTMDTFLDLHNTIVEIGDRIIAEMTELAQPEATFEDEGPQIDQPRLLD